MDWKWNRTRLARRFCSSLNSKRRRIVCYDKPFISLQSRYLSHYQKRQQRKQQPTKIKNKRKINIAKCVNKGPNDAAHIHISQFFFISVWFAIEKSVHWISHYRLRRNAFTLNTSWCRGSPSAARAATLQYNHAKCTVLQTWQQAICKTEQKNNENSDFWLPVVCMWSFQLIAFDL